MIVTEETKRLLIERRNARLAEGYVKEQKQWGEAHFTLFYRDYIFHGSSRPMGFKYCLRNPTGECAVHGIVFGPLKNAVAELPNPCNTWKLPTKWSPRPIMALGTCNQREENHDYLYENDRGESATRGI